MELIPTKTICELLAIKPRTVKQWLYADPATTPKWIIGSISKGFKPQEFSAFLERNPEYKLKIAGLQMPAEAFESLLPRSIQSPPQPEQGGGLYSLASHMEIHPQ